MMSPLLRLWQRRAIDAVESFHPHPNPVQLRPRAGQVNIDALVEVLLQMQKTPERNEGLLDSGLYRDHLANRLGARFGRQVFDSPALTPAIPYDVGKGGGQCFQVNGVEVCRYEFP